MTIISEPVATDAPAAAAFRKTHLVGSRPDLRVPMREVALTTGDRVVLYDTSGPYTDTSITTDITRGLEPLREQWILERGDTVAYRGRVAQPVHDGYADASRRE